VNKTLLPHVPSRAEPRVEVDCVTCHRVARRLLAANDTASAIAILEMNGEYYPKSAAIDFQLGELHRMRAERDEALQSYRAALEKTPDLEVAKTRIEEMEKK
jgi:tetratricopeptide (TPR) repeat protein